MQARETSIMEERSSPTTENNEKDLVQDPVHQILVTPGITNTGAREEVSTPSTPKSPYRAEGGSRGRPILRSDDVGRVLGSRDVRLRPWRRGWSFRTGKRPALTGAPTRTRSRSVVGVP